MIHFVTRHEKLCMYSTQRGWSGQKFFCADFFVKLPRCLYFLGKLSDESLDSLVSELERVSTEDGEGEAARYYLHARNLKQTIQFLRSNQAFKCESDAAEDMCLPLDLVRCESLQSLDPRTASRLLSKNYA